MAATAGPRRAPLALAAALILGLLLGAQSLRLRAAEKAVRDGNGTLAYQLRPQNGWAAALHAEDVLNRNDAVAARSLSRAALDRTPYAAIALRTLARSLERTEGLKASEAAWQVASSLGWRDKPTQSWAVLRALSNGQADVFAMRADALLRTPGDNRAMTSLVRQAMVVPELRNAFVTRLVQRPPWRAPFFDVDRPLRGRELEGTAIALFSLAPTTARPSRHELADTIAGLLAAGRYDEAFRLDQTFVQRSGDAGSLLDDGGFELAGTDYVRGVTPFDWMIVDGTATLDRSGGRRSIAVTSEGASGAQALVRYKRLRTGSYRLRYQIQGDAAAPAAISLSVTCVTTGAVLGKSDPAPLQNGNWQAREFRFDNPASCPLLKIAVTPARTDPSVTALIDDVAILRL